MRALWKFAAIIFAMLIAPSLAQAQVDTFLTMKRNQILRPSCVVETARSTGSCATIFSALVGPEGKKKVATFVITNYHVIKSAVDAKMPVQVSWIQYNDDFREIGTLIRIATVFRGDEENDLALLLLNDHKNLMPDVARIAPLGVKLQPFERMWTVGATYAEPVLLSEGTLSSMDVYFPGGTRYMRMQMYANVGNSGGGLFHFDEKRGYEMVGIVSAIHASRSAKKIPFDQEKKDEPSRPEDVENKGEIKTDGNISFAIPPEILHRFLMQVGRQIGINFFSDTL